MANNRQQDGRSANKAVSLPQQVLQLRNIQLLANLRDPVDLRAPVSHEGDSKVWHIACKLNADRRGVSDQ